MGQKIVLTTEDNLFRVETILRYYRLRGANKEKVNEIKHKLLKQERDEQTHTGTSN
jgi:hypothetical protein